MKKIIAVTASAICALALTACGGGGGGTASPPPSSTFAGAAEGIWSNLGNGAYATDTDGMQAVIGSSGWYWSVSGPIVGDGSAAGAAFLNPVVSYGTVSVNGSSVVLAGPNGSYSGTASAQSALNLTSGGSSNGGTSPVNFNLGYDGIYNQPAPLSAIAGNYAGGSHATAASCPPPPAPPQNGPCYSISSYPNLTISGSNLVMLDAANNVLMMGTILSGGVTDSVYTIRLTVTSYGVSELIPNISVGTYYDGIMFKTSSGILKNKIEIAAAGTDAGTFFWIGSKSGNSSATGRADEGIWSNLDSGTAAPYTGMQAIILDDGSYWGVYGQVQSDGTLASPGILHGVSSVQGGSVSGAYTALTGNSMGNYSGTAAAQNNLELTFAPPLSSGPPSANMSYDSIYNQPASISAIAGNYLGYSYGNDFFGNQSNLDSPGLTISGANLSLNDQNGNAVYTGTITPHGTAVNVFDVVITSVTHNSPDCGFGCAPSIVLQGILFQNSSGILKNTIEMVAASGTAYGIIFIGNKQN